MGTALVTTLLAAWVATSFAADTANAGADPEGPSPEARGETSEGRAETSAPPEPPGAGCPDDSVDALQSRYEKVRDLRARFLQTTRPAHMGPIAPEPVTSTGHMVVAKPAKMRWEYETPEKSLVVSDGESLWTYDPAFGEAQRLRVSEGFLSGAAVQFLLGEGDLRRDFRITLVSCGEDSVELALSPRQPATYEKLRVVVDRTTGTLSRTQVIDLLGNVTIVELSQLETNVDPDPETFRFVAPEGVSVIELDPAGALRP